MHDVLWTGGRTWLIDPSFWSEYFPEWFYQPIDTVGPFYDEDRVNNRPKITTFGQKQHFLINTHRSKGDNVDLTPVWGWLFFFE